MNKLTRRQWFAGLAAVVAALFCDPSVTAKPLWTPIIGSNWKNWRAAAWGGRTMRYPTGAVTYREYTFDGPFSVDVPARDVLDRNGNKIATEYTVNGVRTTAWRGISRDTPKQEEWT